MITAARLQRPQMITAARLQSASARLKPVKVSADGCPAEVLKALPDAGARGLAVRYTKSCAELEFP